MQVKQKLSHDPQIFIVHGKVAGVRNVSDFFSFSGESLKSFPCSKIHGSSPALILCSTGTTGLPKGILQNHTTLLHKPFFLDIDENSILSTFNTLHWTTGMSILIQSLVNGLKLIITNKPFTPKYLAEVVEKHQITHIMLNTRYLTEAAKQLDTSFQKQLSSLQHLYTGGSIVPNAIVLKFYEIFGTREGHTITVMYGLSEAAGGIAVNDDPPEKLEKFRTGRLLANSQVRIVDKNGQNLGINEEGVVYYKFTHAWDGFLGNPKATNETLQNGWIKTGDIGYFDTDGYLTLSGRESEAFKVNGFQMYPAHIEEVIKQVPGVLEVCVCGIPNDKVAHLIACAVVADENDNPALASLIEETVKSKMTEPCYLTGGVHFMKSFPYNVNGKVIRKKVLELITGDK